MFAYNPQVQDQSGQILGQYQSQAAKTQAESQAALGQNIGKGISDLASTVAGAYMKNQTMEAQGKAAKDLFKVMAPAAGIDPKSEDFLQLNKMSNKEFAVVSDELFKVMPSMISSNSYGKLFTNAALKNAAAQPPPNQQPYNANQNNNTGGANIEGNWMNLVPNRR